jgi:hypothetical protein
MFYNLTTDFLSIQAYNLFSSIIFSRVIQRLHLHTCIFDGSTKISCIKIVRKGEFCKRMVCFWKNIIQTKISFFGLPLENISLVNWNGIN